MRNNHQKLFLIACVAAVTNASSDIKNTEKEQLLFERKQSQPQSAIWPREFSMMDLIRPTSENKSQLTRQYPPETELRLDAKLEVYHELHEDGGCFYCGPSTDKMDDECIDFCSKPYPMVNQMYWQQTFSSSANTKST